MVFEGLSSFLFQWIKPSSFLMCSSFPSIISFSVISVIDKCSDLQQQPFCLSSLMMMGQEFRQDTAGGLVSVPWCLEPQLGWHEELRVMQTAGGWNHLEAPHPHVWCLGWDHSRAGLSWGCQPDMWHLYVAWASHSMSWFMKTLPKRMLQDSQGGCCITFSDLASEIARQAWFCQLKWLQPCLGASGGTYIRSLSESSAKEFGMTFFFFCKATSD
jgi:hypothetical protein